MNIKSILTDDDAVSPVIGVILMVAITVILAAVIATFVLGLGDSLSDSAPQATFSSDWNGAPGSPDTLDITHSGGDSIEASNLYLRGIWGSESPNSGQISEPFTSGSNIVDTYGTDSKVKSGNRISLQSVGADSEVDIVWENSEGENSATLSSWDGPDA